MMSSWDSYYVVFLSAVLSLVVPGALTVASFFFFSKRGFKKSFSPRDMSYHAASRTVLGQRVNVRFFLAVNAALVLIALALELIPSATTLHSEDAAGRFKGLIAIVSIATFSILGLLYSVRKGDMGWLSSFQDQSSPERKNS
jgi:hypothetical protein